ncbi:hypothetical protein ACSBR1_008200 [Camellia fascicularis]
MGGHTGLQQGIRGGKGGRSVRQQTGFLVNQSEQGKGNDAANSIPVANPVVPEKKTWASVGGSYKSEICCETKERECQFGIDIKRAQGLEVKRMLEDGNCLFRAVADQLYVDSDTYDLVRQMCIDYKFIWYDYSYVTSYP